LTVFFCSFAVAATALGSPLTTMLLDSGSSWPGSSVLPTSSFSASSSS
jgi:hypothetical protein